ncbi:hypothetical protein GBA52_005897 [Prunus armeniaca]|nr:hypothetical protein GBA52_005897 [Prunus armeniaca]
MDPPHAVDRNTNIGEINQEHCCFGKLDGSSELRGMKPGTKVGGLVPDNIPLKRTCFLYINSNSSSSSHQSATRLLSRVVLHLLC